MSPIEIIFLVVFFPLAATAGALSVWALALLAWEGRWLLFALAIPFGTAVGLFLLGERRPPLPREDVARLLIWGALLALSLLLPPWVFALLLLFLVAVEIKIISYCQSRIYWEQRGLLDWQSWKDTSPKFEEQG